MDRRSFLNAALASALGAGGCATHSPPAFARSDRDVDLSALRRLRVVLSDPVLGRCAYVADTGIRSVARPVLHARTGDPVDFVIENRLPQPTTVHFHGLTLPESVDGAGFDPVLPGESRRIRFELRNRAGLYWIHSHAHGFTAEQVHSGLASLLLVHDSEDDALVEALSLGPASQLAVLLADARIANGVIAPYAPGADECLHGWFGNRMIANGVPDAAFQVSPGRARLRLLNACNARGLLLAFRERSRPDLPPRRFHLLGTDGGLLAAPLAVDRLFLHGGERVDVLVDIQPGESLQAVSLPFDPRHQAAGDGIGRRHPSREQYPPLAAAGICAGVQGGNASLPDGALLPLFALEPAPGPGAPMARLPERLSGIPAAWRQDQSVSRRIRLDFDPQHGYLIENLPYHPDEAGIAIARGAREVWEVRNSPISMPHPMHLHGFQFRVLRRQGTFGPARALATQSDGRLPSDLGFKDTVAIWPNETVWLETDFSLPSDDSFKARQRYMFHCHNLEHEDGMMMRNVTLA